MQEINGYCAYPDTDVDITRVLRSRLSIKDNGFTAVSLVYAKMERSSRHADSMGMCDGR